MELLASLASANLLELRREIERLGDWPYIHLDIEDGNFTPNITFGMKMLQAVAAEIAPRRLDVHLMANHPVEMLGELAKAGVASVSAHLEALRFPMVFLQNAHDRGMRAGLALNISTPWQAVLPFLEKMDFLLVMTAEPDGCGEQLNQYAVNKAIEAAGVISVYADGALDRQTVLRLAKAGVTGCVLGRLVFSSKNPRQTLLEINEA